MCGIVGYVGHASGDREYFALDVVVEGLHRLEYRGYDSAGVAMYADGEISWRKKAGKVAALDDEIAARPLKDSVLGIGHTRWATHGAATQGADAAGRLRAAGGAVRRADRGSRADAWRCRRL